MLKLLKLLLFLFLFQAPLFAENCKVFLESRLRVEIDHGKSFLYDGLLKKKHLFNKDLKFVSDDLNPINFYQIQKNLPPFEWSSMESRQQIISDFKIENIVAAPGHRFLRNKKQVAGLEKYIKESSGGDFSHDKILLNLIIEDNKLISVDLWNAHHRLVAYLEAGYETIGQLKLSNLEILINGERVNGEKWGHYLSLAGINSQNLKSYSVVPAHGEIRNGTVSVDGAVSNFQLGSRNSLKQLRFNTKTAIEPKVGVYFGTFNPIHEGHIGLIKQAKKLHGLDEVLIVPNINPIHKSGVTDIKLRNEMIAARIKNEPGLNLYVGDSAEIIDKFGRDPFFERVTQIYGSYNLHQLIGDDSFMKIMNEGGVEKNLFRKYIVFKRKGGPAIPEPETDKYIISGYEDNLGLSSTTIRNKIKENKKTNLNELHPEVLKVIEKNELYR